MYELPNAIIVIPVRIDHPKRLKNLERNVLFLKTHLRVDICVIEQDSEPRVPESLNPIFVRNGDTFHKARLFNLALQTTSKQVCFCLDVDILMDPGAYMQAYSELMNDRCDVCLLYTRNNPAYKYTDVNPDIFDGKDPNQWMDILASQPGTTATCEGGIVAFQTKHLRSIGGFNERFIGYGQEDTEIIVRSKKLGLRYREFPFSIYHQSHDQLYLNAVLHKGHISPYIYNVTAARSATDLRRELVPSHPKFVTIALSGGRLGNNLFELATLFQYAKQTCRLPFAPIYTPYASFFKPLLAHMTYPQSDTLSRKIVRPIDPSYPPFYTEFPLLFDDTPVLELNGGYAQSPEMFRDVKWMFQDALGSKEPSYPETRVMIHVRKGDYNMLSDKYEQLGELYYTRAMAYVRSRIPGCTFVVFSDDLQAVKTLSYFQREEISFFEDTGMEPGDVLREMSRYTTFILANSTFGVWGVLLSKNPSLVIAPMHWSRIDTSQCLGFWNTIYEPEWVRISNRPLTIRSDLPEFDIFAPTDPDCPADIAIYTKDVPTMRPNAHIVAVVSNHPETYTSKERPPTVDYVFSTTMQHSVHPHVSWENRPIVYVGNPGTLSFFHYIQTVTETLRTQPSLSIVLLNTADDRPGKVFQTLQSIYQQTDRSWEIIFPFVNGCTGPIGKYTLPFLAIPKLLCVLIVGMNSSKCTRYTRSSLVAYAKVGTLLSRNRLELQRKAVKQGAISAMNFTDESGSKSIIPFSTSSRIGTMQQPKYLRSTFMFHKHLLNSDQWFDLNTPIQILHEVGVGWFPEIYGISKSTELTPPPPPPAMPDRVDHGEAILVSGMHRATTAAVQSQLVRWKERQTYVSQAKKSFGVKYLL